MKEKKVKRALTRSCGDKKVDEIKIPKTQPYTFLGIINGEPVCREVNQYPKCECKLFTKQFEECPYINKSVTNCSVFQTWQTEENNLKEFKIENKMQQLNNNYWSAFYTGEDSILDIMVGDQFNGQVINGKVRIV